MKRTFNRHACKRTPWTVIAILCIAVIAGAITAVVQGQSNGLDEPLAPTVRFCGEYRIAEGAWRPLTDTEHLPATQDTVELRGAFLLLDSETGEELGPVEQGSVISLYLNHLHATIRDADGRVWTSDVENPYLGKGGCAEARAEYLLTGNAGEALTITLQNPHVFGNGRAIDGFLNTMRLGNEESGGLFSESGVFRLVVGGLLLAFLLVLLGASLLASLLRKAYDREIWLLWLLVFFGGVYFLFSRENVGLWSAACAAQTMVIGASMMLYLITAYAIIVGYLNGVPGRIATVAVALLGLAALVALLAALHPALRFYDTYPYFIALAASEAVLLMACQVISLASRREGVSPQIVRKNRRIHLSSMAVLLCFLADALATACGVWQGGMLSVGIFLLIVLASIVIIGRGLTKSVKTILDAKSMEAERQAMEMKLQESQISIMLSQIQPHFLYNTLNSIYQLCETNPMRARSMVNSFAEYLRNNLSTLEEPGLISFETELAHVNTYLDIERVRFEDTLEIEYDIRCVDFSLPVLTVQPLVENAVKHGTSKKRGGGRVTIATEEDRDSYIIRVSDTGCGFDPTQPKNDGKRHVGIENVRQRLANMCAGSLTIESTVGEGTHATIRIPKGGKHENHSR